jgi:hypothetical protein
MSPVLARQRSSASAKLRETLFSGRSSSWRSAAVRASGRRSIRCSSGAQPTRDLDTRAAVLSELSHRKVDDVLPVRRREGQSQPSIAAEDVTAVEVLGAGITQQAVDLIERQHGYRRIIDRR